MNLTVSILSGEDHASPLRGSRPTALTLGNSKGEVYVRDYRVFFNHSFCFHYL